MTANRLGKLFFCVFYEMVHLFISLPILNSLGGVVLFHIEVDLPHLFETNMKKKILHNCKIRGSNPLGHRNS